MSMEVIGKMGPRPGSDGNEEVLRLGKEGYLTVADAVGKYYEPCSRGQVFGVSNQAGITTQAGLSPTTPALTLFNPKGSGVNAEILFAGYNASVAFAAAALIWLGLNTNIAAADVTGTLSTAVRNMLVGNGKASQIQALLAATLPVAPVAGPSIGVGLTGAITTLPSVPTQGRWFDGSLILSPGSAVSFQTSAASGALGFFGEFIWRETLIT